MRPPAHYDLPNRRRNLPACPNWKKNNDYEVYSIREEIGPIVSRDLKTQELFRKCVTVVKTLTDEQAAQFQQLIDEAVSNNCTNNAQFYQDLKIVLEILEDLTNNENREEMPIIHLPPYIKIAPLKKLNVYPYILNQMHLQRKTTYLESILRNLVRPSANLKDLTNLNPLTVDIVTKTKKKLKGNTKPSKHYQRSAEIREDSEAHEVDKKVAEVERVDEVTKPNLNNKIKIKEEGPRECRDLAEIDGTNKSKLSRLNNRKEILNDKDPGGSNQGKLVKNNKDNNKEKKIARTECPLEGEALNHACERWLERVKNFQITCKWNKESKIKEPLTKKSTKEIVNVDNCSHAVIGVKENKNKVFSLH
ncbi:hypothetical protein C2G38_2047417 [Gigaspora rosea]|uniref:Uncharacterized protein n=1 Tax=Gigaspora rosea TaxID=44941 RepID=A0A397U7I9_9GLOM|nr:hypothetical protein C2G38_2047417 [Gigaspora rosea]